MTSSPSLPWWKSGVIYQIYPRSFMDSNADGIGDLHGIIGKLDFLGGKPESLGVDAIWLSPFYPSPMADFGYDVADYCNVHPMFGDLTTLDRLVSEAHRRNIKIIIDWVPNHTSNEHPWFLESRKNKTNPKADWYIWRDAKPDGSPPNNWGAMFGGSAWERDDLRKQYYLHLFLKEQPDLNWRNPAVKQAMFDTLHFWLKRGVDGFRMDVLGMIYKHPEYPDNPPNPDIPPNIPKNDLWNRHLPLYNQDQDDVHDVLKEIRKLLDGYGETVAIGEIWYDLPRWIKYFGESGEEIHIPFNFRLIQLPWKATAIRASVDEMEAALPPFAWPNYVLGNHDQRRLATRVGAAQTRVAAMLLLTLRGTPTLYYGDEIGIEDGEIDPAKFQDPSGIRLGPKYCRDYCRTPMQWDSHQYAGFSTVEPWLPISRDHQTRNVEQQNTDSKSLLNFYRHLLHLRRKTPALNKGSYKPIATGEDGCYAYLRSNSDEVYLVALNFTGQPMTPNIHALKGGRVILSTHLDREESLKGESLRLRANEAVVVALG